MNVAYITHPSFMRHEMGSHHPECPERLTAISDRLLLRGVLDLMDTLEAPEATFEQLDRAHDMRLYYELKAAAPSEGYVSVDPDTAMNPHTWTAALHAAGALVLATEVVARGDYRRAFCAVRPPGHHATSDRAMGFCFFNNVAVGIRHATAALGMERVALIDFDVHHGNGSEEILAGDEQVLMVSTFQTQLYPFNGEEARGANMCNVGLPPYSDGAALRAAVTERWLPALREFRPQMLFVSAGFDAHREDDMSHLGWRDEDYAWVSREIVRFADEMCEGRIVSALEGGYHVPSLARAVELHLRALLDLD
ncbi:MAG: histone deacetylase family protein [Lautropia sp.]|nr:MAG: histone deacetylase family protein [Pseudomonadota bacterium]MBC6958615.1 histone deacetylase family protein [Lautropia sp.]MCL4700935.1 histone deacetylase family protein [Burkholderiaceae bacterium]MCZ2413796.1 histone deacetylase family protein [Burkholderiales bacterium]MDL1907062.1 histone deacetylase family protein [Betaproteobacteria bacterium PRO1]